MVRFKAEGKISSCVGTDLAGVIGCNYTRETALLKHQQSVGAHWESLQSLSDVWMESAEIKLTKLGKMEDEIIE